MKRWLDLAAGVLIGQWLAFGGVPSPAAVYQDGVTALEQHDYVEAARLWSRAVSLQPDNARFHYLLGTALARLGHQRSAAESYQVALLLDPPEPLARLARSGLAELQRVPSTGSSETVVPLESVRGVWVAPVRVNGGDRARFLVDTGASVTLVSPALAKRVGVTPTDATSLPLETVGGRTSAPTATVRSLRVGDLELRDSPVVIHDPGPGVDGILGNSFLSRYAFAIDADRRLLTLRPLAAR